MMPEIKPTLPGQAKLVTFEEDGSSGSYDLSTTGSAFTVAEEALERIGMGNRYVLYIVFAMALAWGLTIMSVMCSAFYETGIHCDPLDDQCHDDRWHMFTIEDEYHIFGGSPLSIEWTASVFFIGDLFGGIILSYLSDMQVSMRLSNDLLEGLLNDDVSVSDER
ncbi:hypothetical protein AAVH_33266 [Aphelenchoides avenae]|nr:hypothetical protein AAVH_33266 [Aphelenchus avenae]